MCETAWKFTLYQRGVSVRVCVYANTFDDSLSSHNKSDRENGLRHKCPAGVETQEFGSVSHPITAEFREGCLRLHENTPARPGHAEAETL